MRTRSIRKACNRPLRTVKLRFRLRSTSQVHLLTPLFYIALQAATGLTAMSHKGLRDYWVNHWCPTQHQWPLVLLRTFFKGICLWRYEWFRGEWKCVGIIEEEVKKCVMNAWMRALDYSCFNTQVSKIRMNIDVCSCFLVIFSCKGRDFFNWLVSKFNEDSKSKGKAILW